MAWVETNEAIAAATDAAASARADMVATFGVVICDPGNLIDYNLPKRCSNPSISPRAR